MTSTPAPEHHTAQVNGTRLHYVRAGQGRPVMLLHGWPQTWYEWRHVVGRLAGDFTVIAPDLRGFGYSGKPAAGYDAETMAADLAALGDHLGLHDVTVIGHQFWGEYRYPNLGVVTANELHIPISDPAHPTPTYLTMSSADTDHSFWVPRLAGKVDLIPNRVNTMWIDPAAAGPLPVPSAAPGSWRPAGACSARAPPPCRCPR